MYPGSNPGAGSAPSTGIAGRGSVSTSAGAKLVPVPTMKPGPATQARAQAARFGR